MPNELTPIKNDSPLQAAQGCMAFMLSVIRCGEQLSEDEVAMVRKTMAELGALKQPRITREQIRKLGLISTFAEFQFIDRLKELGIEVESAPPEAKV